MFFRIFEILINFWQGFLMIWCIQQVLHQKKKYRWITILSVLLIGVLLTVDQYIMPAVPDYVYFVIPFAYAIITSEDDWLYSVLWATIETVAFIGTILLVGNLIVWMSGADWQTMLEANVTHIIYVVVANVALSFTAGLIAWIGRKQALISIRASIIFIVLLLLAFVINECLYLIQIHAFSDTPLLIAALSSFISVVLMILMYDIMNAEAENKRHTEIALQTALLVQQHQEELRGMYMNMLSSQHDLRHRISTAESLLAISNDNEQKKKAMELLRETVTLPEYVTGNIAIDAVLKAKSSIMEMAGIQYKFSLYPLNVLPLQENDFCVLLSNILDNAIEGVMRLPAGASSRAVQLIFSSTGDMFSIDCINDYNPSSIKQRGERFLSSKEAPQLHGFGTINMKEIVENNDGCIRFITTASKFRVILIIPFGRPT